VYTFLSQPRTWDDIHEWREKTKVMGGTRLRHCLAWLENNGRVWCHSWGDVLRWGQSGWSAAATDALDDILRNHHAEDDRNATKAYRRHVEPVDEQQDGPDDGGEEDGSEDDLEDGDHSVPR